MFKFGYPIMLWILAIVVPLLIVIYLLFYRQKKHLFLKFAENHLHTKILYGYNPIRKHIKFLFLLLGIAFLLFAASDPKIGSKLKKVKYKGAEIIIALDISNSMLAEDVYPSRLEAAKMAVERLIDKLEHNRIGLIVFAGEAFVQLPITSDYVSAKMFLKTISPELISIQGTNFAAAIELATRSFSTQDKETNKVLIIISDGEDHEGGAIETANLASQKGIIIHTIGMGKPEGAPIPIINKFGKKDYKVDKNGNIIITKTNDVLLQQIATAANGLYVRAQNISTILNEIIERIEKLNTTEKETEIYADYDHQYQYPLLFALIFLITEFFFLERTPKHTLFKTLKLLTSNKVSLIIIITILLTPKFVFSQNYKKEIREGTNYFLNNKYKEAEVAYRKAYKLNPGYFKSTYNLGNALYKQDKFEEAEKQFLEAPTKSTNSNEQAKAYHNLGNTYLMQKKIDESIEAYKNALRKNPNDTQTKYNLSYALMLKKQQNQQQQNKQQQQQQNQQQQNQHQQQQQNQQQKSEEKISKQEAERMLKALQNEEQKKQEEIKKKQAIMRNRNIEKDW